MNPKRIISVLLALAIIVSCVYVAGTMVASGADKDTAASSAYLDMLARSSSPDYGLAPTVNEGTILQAWNWSFKNIEANLKTVAEQGFTTIQVSPPNEIKAATAGVNILESDNKNGWWMFYQPTGFQLNNSAGSAMGTKAEFVEMCEKAHEYGLKIIVDAVINHMGTCDNEDTISDSDPMKHLTPLAKNFEPEIVNAKAFHSPWAPMQYLENDNQFPDGTSYDKKVYDSTYDMTRNCTSRLPDLDTSKQVVQKAIYDYMDELLAAGADGFRFDAAKHIETSKDVGGLSSDFWENTLGKVRKKYAGQKEVYAYGEILNSCGYGRPFSMYTELFDVTDSSAFYSMKDVVINGWGDATPFYPSANFTSENVILWDESHDTYMDGATTGLTVEQRGKIWALCAGRAGITTVYLARPDDSLSTDVCYYIKLGEARQTAWSNETTKAINQFHNYFLGQSEYCTSDMNGYAYIERGDSGAIIVGRGDRTTGNVTLTNHQLKDGTYKDEITGNEFYVSNGTIRGKVGSTGVACIYFHTTEVPTQPTPPPDVIPTQSGYNTIIFTNTEGWEGSIYLYYWKSGQQGPIAWPGEEMEAYDINENNQPRKIGYIPEGYDNLIVANKISDSAYQQTIDTPFSGHTGVYADSKNGEGKYISITYPLQVIPPTEKPTQNPTNPPAKYMVGDADKDGELTILDATAIQRALAGLKNEKYDAKAADADEDGEVSILDATAVQRKLAGLSTDAKRIGKWV